LLQLSYTDRGRGQEFDITVNFYKTIQWRLALVLAGAVIVLATGPAVAQDNSAAIDTTPPVIELEELADGVADST